VNVGRYNNVTHPQLMPGIACGSGQCLVTYWESRTSALSANGWIGGYHRLMDLRGASLQANGTVGRSFQISRYPYRPGTKLVDPSALGADGKPRPRPENVNDIARVNETIDANGTRSCTGPTGIEPPLAGLESGCVPDWAIAGAVGKLLLWATGAVAGRRSSRAPTEPGRRRVLQEVPLSAS
jgi:hypothetical protein